MSSLSQSLALEWYGASADCRFHCFSLVDSAGTPVYNLRCESREEAERWRNAFATVGCEVRWRRHGLFSHALLKACV